MTKNSGLADSPFFSLTTDASPSSPMEKPLPAVPTPPPEPVPALPKAEQKLQADSEPPRRPKKVKTKQPHNRDVKTSRNHDVMTSLHHDAISPDSEDVVSKLRSLVKQIGKEPTTCRLTTEEKNLLKDVEYEFSKRGIATSGNEILRIAINFIIGDYKENGEQSILDKVLKALNE